MKIRKDDNIIVISGKDKGRKGKVQKVYPKSNKIIVDGFNIIKKHRRPRRQGEKGEIVPVPAPFNVSNVKLICPKCNKGVRIGYTIEDNKKLRICKKCKAKI